MSCLLEAHDQNDRQKEAVNAWVCLTDRHLLGGTLNPFIFPIYACEEKSENQ